MESFLNIYLSLVAEAVPFLLLAALFSTAIARLGLGTSISRGLVKATSHNPLLAAIAGSSFSLITPVCECGSPTIARQLRRQGASASFVISYLISAPVLNPITLFTTWLAFQNFAGAPGGTGILLARVGLALAVAVLVGITFSFQANPTQLFSPDNQATLLQPLGSSALDKQPNLAVFHLLHELGQALSLALPGLAIAAAFQTWVPADWVGNWTEGALLSALALIALGVVMSVCSSVDAFVAVSFATIFPVGSVIGFLVFSSALNLKNVLLLRLALRPVAIALIAGLALLATLAGAVFINLWVV